MMKSIHFPQFDSGSPVNTAYARGPRQAPPEPSKANGRKTQVHEAEEVVPKYNNNVIDVLREASRDLTTITHEFHGVILSENRHGSLIVIRGACIRFMKALEVMIKAEEQ